MNPLVINITSLIDIISHLHPLPHICSVSLPAAVVLDFFMRLGWAFVISPDQRYVAENYMLLLGNTRIDTTYNTTCNTPHNNAITDP